MMRATLWLLPLLTLPLRAGEMDIPEVDVERLRKEVHFLASDELNGRAMGTRENKITSRYLSLQFKEMGLTEAGDEGYFQNFDLVTRALSGENSLSLSLNSSDASLRPFDDFFPSLLSAAGRAAGGLVFGGYGITAPEYDYDDFRGVEMRGRVALLLEGEPQEANRESLFSGLLRSRHGEPLHKILNAQKNGASAVLLVRLQADPQSSLRRLGYSRWPRRKRRGPRVLDSWLDQIRIPVLHISHAQADRLLEPTGNSVRSLSEKIDRGPTPHSFEIEHTTVTASTSMERVKTLPERNVLGIVTGSDPELSREMVVVGAHFDHMQGERAVYNGADDNASGTAALLAIARRLSSRTNAPRRSILFAAWNAEEHGLLGSYHYVARPAFPLIDTVAMLQMDMVGRDQEIPETESNRFFGLEPTKAAQNRNTLNVLGYSRSPKLKGLVRTANRRVGLDLRFRYDNQDLGLLRRSDQWPFLSHRIPSLFFFSGLHPDYHRPTDTADKINYTKLARVVGLVGRVAWELADRDRAPGFKDR